MAAPDAMHRKWGRPHFALRAGFPPIQAKRLVALALCGAAIAVLGHTAANAGETLSQPLRMGILHPRPHLCDGWEPSQRDIRIFRLAFGNNLAPGHRLELPWYITESRSDNGNSSHIALNIEALWGFPAHWVREFPPDFRQPVAYDPLALWRATVAREIGRELGGSWNFADSSSDPPYAPPYAPQRGHLLWRSRGDPFWASRLQGSTLIPRADWGPSSDLGGACPSWPAGVWLEKRNDRRAYRMTIAGRDGGQMIVDGYREPQPMWRDFLRGRIDILILQGADVALLAGRISRERGLIWGLESGTQQIAVLPSPGLVAVLGPERIRALSQAVNREDLTGIFAPGEYRTARAIFQAVLPRGNTALREPAAGLTWNPREARRTWLSLPALDLPLRIVTIDHPGLVAMARRISNQWQRTLNLPVAWVAITAEEFGSEGYRSEFDLLLTVADMDNGSLQDLWIEALSTRGTPLSAHPRGQPSLDQIESWERDLAAHLSYLPLLENVHLVLTRSSTAAARIREVCPACTVPAPAPPIRYRPRKPPAPSPAEIGEG